MSFVAIAAAAALAACQGIATNGGALPGADRRGAIAPKLRTTAWGILVDDPSGKPLAHVPVALDPWLPCSVGKKRRQKTLTCPTPVTTTTTAWNGRFVLHAAPGHYLLTIGSDSTEDMTRPTIHDNVTLASGTQHLIAPEPCPTLYKSPPGAPAPGHCLPPIPLVPPAPMESNGDYRLVTLTKDERLCTIAFDQERTQRHLESAVVDEWLTENNRASMAYYRNPKHVPFGNGGLTGGFAFGVGGNMKPVYGHSACWLYSMQATAFSPAVPNGLAYSGDPRTHWMAGVWQWYDIERKQQGAVGNAQYPRDPRNEPDPYVYNWP
ncbi:MAG TPA: hypothetical protein VNG31_09485 [Candidatus Baltobacteraceae bacterium]|nr:hypothetical protein [Candidatus Baltobacteraceae bacterium]